MSLDILNYLSLQHINEASRSKHCSCNLEENINSQGLGHDHIVIFCHKC